MTVLIAALMLTAVHHMQAIQARQVLRGTVTELVKETRRQEAEGTQSFLLALHATLSAVHALIHAHLLTCSAACAQRSFVHVGKHAMVVEERRA